MPVTTALVALTHPSNSLHSQVDTLVSVPQPKFYVLLVLTTPTLLNQAACLALPVTIVTKQVCQHRLLALWVTTALQVSPRTRATHAPSALTAPRLTSTRCRSARTAQAVNTAPLLHRLL